MTGAGFSSGGSGATLGMAGAGAGSGELLEVASVNELVDDCLLDVAEEDVDVFADVGLCCCCNGSSLFGTFSALWSLKSEAAECGLRLFLLLPLLRSGEVGDTGLISTFFSGLASGLLRFPLGIGLYAGMVLMNFLFC